MLSAIHCPGARADKMSEITPVLEDFRRYGAMMVPEMALPLELHVEVEDNRLNLVARGACGEERKFLLHLTPLRRLIKDYRIICETYSAALAGADPRRAEAIDMGRRAFHNEGGEWLQERLGERLKADIDTYRYLFSLVNMLYL